MDLDLLGLYRRTSDWTRSHIVAAAAQLDAPTPCDEWTTRQLLNHMLETQRYFAASARGEDASPPGPMPPSLLSDDPVRDFDTARDDVLTAFADPEVVEKTGPALGIAFGDLLLHGWDLARATGRDAAMPPGTAEAAYQLIHGRFTDEQRKGVFKPEVEIGDDASPQDRLLAYVGRDPR